MRRSQTRDHNDRLRCSAALLISATGPGHAAIYGRSGHWFPCSPSVDDSVVGFHGKSIVGRPLSAHRQDDGGQNWN